MSVIISNGYCLYLMTLFSWRELLIKRTLLSSFLKVFLCGYQLRVSSNIFLLSCSTQGKSAFWCAFRWVSPFMTSANLSFHTWRPESLSQSFWVNLHQRAHLWLGCETCLPWHQICLNPNLQVDKVGWTSQTIPVFFLSSSIWIQYWKASLYSGWCPIWHCYCQGLKPFVDWCACFFTKLGQSLVSHCDDFLRFKVTCKGPHKFGITKQLCDHTFR